MVNTFIGTRRINKNECVCMCACVHALDRSMTAEWAQTTVADFEQVVPQSCKKRRVVGARLASVRPVDVMQQVGAVDHQNVVLRVNAMRG